MPCNAFIRTEDLIRPAECLGMSGGDRVSQTVPIFVNWMKVVNSDVAVDM